MPVTKGKQKPKQAFKKLKKYVAAREKKTGTNNKLLIPKKIFQTWESSIVSNGMYNAVQSWIDKNPDWEYHFFDNDDRREFIKENFPKKVLIAYESLNPGSYKAGLWRFCVLYINGGIYADIKSMPIISMNEIIPKDASFLVCKDKSFRYQEFDGYIYTAFICSKAKSPFLKKTIDKVVDNINNGDYGNDQLSPTGPGAFGKGVNIALNRKETSEFLPGKFKLGKSIYYIWPVPEFKNNVYITDKNISFLQYSYPGYLEDKSSSIKSLESLQREYSFCWFFGSAYQGDSNKNINLSSQYYLNRKSYFVLKLFLTLCKNKCWKEAFCTLIKCFKSKKITVAGLFKLALEVVSCGKI